MTSREESLHGRGGPKYEHGHVNVHGYGHDCDRGCPLHSQFLSCDSHARVRVRVRARARVHESYIDKQY